MKHKSPSEVLLGWFLQVDSNLDYTKPGIVQNLFATKNKIKNRKNTSHAQLAVVSVSPCWQDLRLG